MPVAGLGLWAGALARLHARSGWDGTPTQISVILNLAVSFAWHVLWPAGFSGGFE